VNLKDESESAVREDRPDQRDDEADNRDRPPNQLRRPNHPALSPRGREEGTRVRDARSQHQDSDRLSYCKVLAGGSGGLTVYFLSRRRVRPSTCFVAASGPLA
jgi:hypothetical protein